MNKICTTCHKEKPLIEFGISKSRGKYGRVAYCKKCSNEYNYKWKKANPDKAEHYKKSEKASKLKQRYRLTLEQHKNMYINQNGCCAVCGKSIEYDKIYVDHSHKRNIVRGLVCPSCNIYIGFIEIHPELLNSIMNYLIKYGDNIDVI